jgi:cyclic pyranopterin phosphate synthase
MPDEEYQFTPTSNLMSSDEIESIVSIFVQQGVKKIRLTGGEPLIRKDAAEIIARLSQFDIELTLTTNGTQLHNFVDVIKNSGIQSLNISLDTLQKERFQLMTKRNLFDRVKTNIDLILANSVNIKINVVVMKGVNDDEINDFIRLTKNKPIHIRFIEFMPFDGNKWNSNKVVKLAEILEKVSSEFEIIPLERSQHETAKKFKIPGHQGTFAVISMSAPFCGDCNRMRLTADGKMKNCLFSTSETDLLTPFRQGEDILEKILHNISTKKEALGGQFTTSIEKIETSQLQNRSMISIGG